MEASDFAEIKELTQLCFGSNFYLNNFPQVFKPQNSEYFFSLRDKNKLVCFCTIYPTYFSIENLYLKGYCIGSVCTHPDYRGRGLASKILLQAEQQAQKFQGDFVYLFSEKNKLYEKAGFQPFGSTVIGVANQHLSSCGELPPSSRGELPLSSRGELPLSSRGLTAGSSQIPFTHEVFCYEGNSLRDENTISKIWSFIVQNSSPKESILSYLEFKDILQIRDLKIYVLCHTDPAASLVSSPRDDSYHYCSVCFLNKGDDFQNVLHGIYYTHHDYAKMLLADIIFEKWKTSTLYFFPGVFSSDFSEFFNYENMTAMYVKVFKKIEPFIFVRSLQGT